MRKRHELINLSLYAIGFSYVFVIYEYFFQKMLPLGWIGDVLSLVFYIVFLFGIFSGLKIIFNKDTYRDQRYWLLAAMEAGSLLFIFVTLFKYLVF